jgi:hypothetical protein
MDTLTGTSTQWAQHRGYRNFLFRHVSKEIYLEALIPSVERDHEVDKHVTVAYDCRSKQ